MPASGRAGVAVGPCALVTAVSVGTGVAVGLLVPGVELAATVAVGDGVVVGLLVGLGLAVILGVAEAEGDGDGDTDGLGLGEPSLVIVKLKSSHDWGASARGSSGAVGATRVSRNW